MPVKPGYWKKVKSINLCFSRGKVLAQAKKMIAGEGKQTKN
jgi:hypothetical protein